MRPLTEIIIAYSIYRFDNDSKMSNENYKILNGHFNKPYQTSPSNNDTYSDAFELGMAAPSLYLH